MKALVINAFSREGVSKKNGEPYIQYFINIGLPFSPVDFGSYKENGYGCNIAELPLEPKALEKFAFMNGKPAYMELTTTEKILFGDLKTVVIDAKVVAPETKAA